MTDGLDPPSIKFEEEIYIRRSRKWVNAKTNLTANVNLSQKIDALAKRDAALWDRCRHQDFADDPKNKHRRLVSAIELDDLGFDFALDSAPRGVQSEQTSRSSRRRRIGENVKIRFRNSAPSTSSFKGFFMSHLAPRLIPSMRRGRT